MKKLSIQVLADDQVKIDTDSFIKAACYFQVLLDHCRFGTLTLVKAFKALYGDKCIITFNID